MHTRHHVNDHGGGSYYIDHLPCTNDDCRREHHYLFTQRDLSDYIGEHILARAADNDIRIIDDRTGDSYDIRRIDDTTCTNYLGIPDETFRCDYDCSYCRGD